MVVRITKRAASALLLLVGLSGLSWSQVPRQRYDPASNQQSSQSRPGFVDFIFGRINPANKDYGIAIAADRNLLLTKTIENAYFWSNLISLSFMGLLLVLVTYQQRRLNGAEMKAADVLDQFEHALARAKAHIEETQKENRAISESHSTLRESLRRNLSQEPASREVTAFRPRPSSTQKKPAANPANGANHSDSNESGSSTTRVPGGAQIALFNGDGDLVMKLNSQEQQITGMREQIALLRKQLSDSEGRLRTEQGKNRSLKGA